MQYNVKEKKISKIEQFEKKTYSRASISKVDISPTKFRWGRKQRETGGVGFAVPSGGKKKKKKEKIGWG